MRWLALAVALVPSFALAQVSLLDVKHVPAPFRGPSAFHAFGKASLGPFSRKRDRIVRFVPRETPGGIVVDVVLDDRAAGKVSRGSFPLDGSGELTGASGEMLSATNLVGITPKVLSALDGGEAAVSKRGQIEANGKVHDVRFTHTKEGGTIVTHVDGDDIALTTRTRMGADSLPSAASTTGHVGRATVDLKLERVE